MKSLSGKLISITQRHGKFFIVPAKKFYKQYKLSGPRQAYNAHTQQTLAECFVGETSDSASEPLVSIIVPAFNTDKSHFSAMIGTILNQHHQNWELIIVNASTSSESRYFINEYCKRDNRIKTIQFDNSGISNNTNAGIKEAKGKYIAFLDHDDLLHVCALHAMVRALENENADIAYSDEDKVTDDGNFYFQPLYKPGWSPDLLRNVNYINHLTVMKRSLVEKAGLLRPECDGAQDYDMLLRAIDQPNVQIVHVPRVLYHWRAAATSTAREFSVKPYVLQAGEKALNDHLLRNKLQATAKAIAGRPGFYNVKYQEPSHVSLVVGRVSPSKRRLVAVWIDELLKHIGDSVHVELIVGEWYKDLGSKDSSFSVKFVEEGAGYLKNAASIASHETIVYFQAGALPRNKQAMIEIVARANALNQIVVPLLVNERNAILDAGLTEAYYGLQPLFVGYHISDDSFYGSTEWTRNITASSLRVAAMPKALFQKIAEKSKTERLYPTDVLAALSNQKTAMCQLHAAAVFELQGYFTNTPLVNTNMTNPNLNKTRATVTMETANWGKLQERSESDNAQ